MTKSVLWTDEAAALATGGILCAGSKDDPKDWAVGGVSIDTRTIERGDLFVALDGEARDGHDFLKSAFDAGAAAALVSRIPEDVPAAGQLLLVADTLAGMRDLARAARERASAVRVAVTGSAGKTSAKEMLRSIFETAGHAHASVKSYNNHWGVPLTLSRMPKDTQFAAFEIGMNHAGEITPLSELVAPDVAIVTTVAPAHLEHFASVEEIAEAKAEIFKGLKPGGVAVLNRDNEYFDLLSERAREVENVRIVSFGEGGDADCRLQSFEAFEEGGRLTFVFEGETFGVTLQLPGRHQAMNALAAFVAARSAGISAEICIFGLNALVPIDGRGARIKLPRGDGDALILDESYNANPASMRAAIKVLGDTPAEGRRIAALGDMLELGADELALHASLAEDLEAAKVDCVYLAGQRMTALREVLPQTVSVVYAPEASELSDKVLGDLSAGDVLMVKGSNASKMKAIIEAAKKELEGLAQDGAY